MDSFSSALPAPDSPDSEVPAIQEPRSPFDRYRFDFSFTGNTAEYFKIWIVNVALTIATLGIYAAWAKVRTRRYFYANTHLDGHSFDYVAKPTRILIGNLIVFVAAALFYLSMEGILPQGVLVGVLVVGFLVFPYLVFKSIRFKTRNSVYRNVRFRFGGTIGEAYKIYLGWAILCGMIGLFYPFWAHRKKQYVYGRMRFGGKPFRFFGDSGKFFSFYFYAFLMGIGIFIPFVVIEGMLTPVGVYPSEPESSWITQAMEFASVGLLWGGYVFLQQFVYGKITKYTFESIELLGDFRFSNTMNAWKLAWISFSNLVLAVLSFGLLIPWGKVRRTRYLVEHLALDSKTEKLSEFVEESEHEDQALGDSAVDFMDFEVGW